MEIGASTRPLGLGAIGEMRPPSPVAPDATRTELPRHAAVQQSGSTLRSEGEPASGRSPGSDNLRRQHTLDIETHKVIYEAIDQRTGEVVYQVPDLRYLKAYADQQKVADESGGEDPSGQTLERTA